MKKLKRREHRKKKQEDRRRAGPVAALLPVPDKSAPSSRALKMSEALEQLARPLLDALPDAAGIGGVQAVMLLAMASWNVAVGCSPEETDKELQKLSLKFAKNSREPPDIALSLLRMLVERKRQLFPHDDRLVLDVAVEDRGDHFHVTAASMRWPR